MTQPHLTLIQRPNAQAIADLFERLTGRKVTPEGMADIEAELAKIKVPPPR